MSVDYGCIIASVSRAPRYDAMSNMLNEFWPLDFVRRRIAYARFGTWI